MGDINLAQVGKMSTTAAAEDDRDLLKYYVEQERFKNCAMVGKLY